MLQYINGSYHSVLLVECHEILNFNIINFLQKKPLRPHTYICFKSFLPQFVPKLPLGIRDGGSINFWKCCQISKIFAE